VAGLIVALTVAGCSGARTAPSTLTVFGAASLSDALADLAAAWQTEHPGSALLTSSGSSAALRAQIEQGAPADVFMSADSANPQTLVDAGLARGPLTEFASNSLVVIVPADNPAAIQSARDLARPGLCIVAAGDHVPITENAEKVVANLAASPDYGTDFGAGYEANVCSREDNVAAVVSKIELGEGDAAIVYASDASLDARLRTIAIPGAANVVATYGAVALASSASGAGAGDSADEFLAWLLSDEAQRILAAHGFGGAP